MITGFVYLWYDRKRKWFCVGSHMGSLDDGYITSTGWMKRAYAKRPEDFKRRIIYTHYSDDPIPLLQQEQRFLDMIKDSELHPTKGSVPASTRYYNMKKNARGLSGKVASELRKAYYDTPEGKEWRKRLSEKFQENNPSVKGRPSWNAGIKCPSISEGKRKNPAVWSEEDRKTKSDSIKKAWENGSYDNRPKTLSEEHRAKISASGRALGRKQSEYQKEKARNANVGKIVSLETRMKISEAKRNLPPKTCPHCGHVGYGPNVYRYHFNNCNSQ